MCRQFTCTVVVGRLRDRESSIAPNQVMMEALLHLTFTYQVIKFLKTLSGYPISGYLTN